MYLLNMALLAQPARSIQSSAQKVLSRLFGKGLAMEELSDGKVFKEIEHVIYAKIVDFDELKKAVSMEHQEQWEVRIPKTDKNAGKGTIRVRKTWIEGGDPTYVITTKIPTNTEGDKIELPLPSNADNFTQFRFLAEQGMKKIRYCFPIIGTKKVWEFDVFVDVEGKPHEWCKIDLEVESRDEPIPEFPIRLDEVILPEGFGRKDPEESGKFISKLYEDFFITKNEFLNPPPVPVNGDGVSTGTEPRLDDPTPKEPAEPDPPLPEALKDKPKDPAEEAPAEETPAEPDPAATPEEEEPEKKADDTPPE